MEDKVQRNNAIINKFWYVIVEYNDENKYNKLINNLETNLYKFKLWYLNIYEIEFKYIISNFDKKDQINIKDNYLIILIDKKNLLIKYFFDHNKIGGNTITYLMSILTLSNEETKISKN